MTILAVSQSVAIGARLCVYVRADHNHEAASSVPIPIPDRPRRASRRLGDDDATLHCGENARVSAK